MQGIQLCCVKKKKKKKKKKEEEEEEEEKNTKAYRLDFCFDVLSFDAPSEILIGQEQLPQHLHATPF